MASRRSAKGLRRMTEARACARKRRFDTRRDATAAMHRMYGAGESPGSLNTYRCTTCGGFHVGHRVGRNAP